MAIGQFKKPVAAAKPVQPTSRWAGATFAKPKDPFPHAGIYRFRFAGGEEGFNPGKGHRTVKLHLDIVSQGEGQTIHTDGDRVMALYFQHTQAGQNGTLMFSAAISGHEDEASYRAFDPKGEFIDALLGHANPRSEEAAAMVGRLVDCRVSKGKPTEDGDYYREYEWAVVAEAEQTA